MMDRLLPFLPVVLSSVGGAIAGALLVPLPALSSEAPVVERVASGAVTHSALSMMAQLNHVADDAIAQSPGSVEPINPYPEEVRDNFMNECTASAIENGALASQAETYCQCSLTEIQRLYTIDEFAVIDQQIAQGQAPPAVFNDIIEFCVNQAVSN
jgi:hypothetical protein